MEHEHKREDYLKKQYDRHPYREFFVLCLMAEKIHSCERTDASAYYRNEKKRGFGDPPCMIFRFQFIDTHSGKSDKIYRYDVKNKPILCGQYVLP